MYGRARQLEEQLWPRQNWTRRHERSPAQLRPRIHSALQQQEAESAAASGPSSGVNVSHFFLLPQRSSWSADRSNARGTNRSKKRVNCSFFQHRRGPFSHAQRGEEQKHYNEGLKAAAASHKDFRSSCTWTLPGQGTQLGTSGPLLLIRHRVAMK